MPLARWFILLAIASLSGCSSVNSNEVFAIKKTGVYHRSECPPVHMAKAVPMSVEQAKSEHLKPCPVCKPDLL
jgi:methylphosphotriester-DNA--protein-cysteine methyltransferase